MGVKGLTTKIPSPQHDGRQPAAVPALTIIAHPDLGRVGDRALLPDLARGRTVHLSRNTPDLAAPGSHLGIPLENLYLSRSPLVLRGRDDGGVVLERGECPMRVQAGGELLDQRREWSAAALLDGVLLELSDRVVLLIHLLREPAEVNEQRLGLVGESYAINAARFAISRVADLEVPVLLRGESGTGKELVARAVHDCSPRRSKPFVAVNLSAITPSLAAAELFGTVRGAYTGAVDRDGFFATADHGTLFLDEVGECPAEVQTTLLRALETGEISPVGSSSRKPRRVDVRLVAATDSDLESKARAGDFKEPLLHRLAAYEIWLAPLRERRDDIGRLLVHFAASAMAELGEQLPGPRSGDAPPWVPAALAARLAGYHWPGNVRQLRNLVRQLVIDSRGRPQLEGGGRLERLLARTQSDNPGGAQSEASAGRVPEAERRPCDISEAELVVAMRDSSWEPAAAARLLRVNRTSLYDLIRKCSRLRTAEDLDPDEIKRYLDDCDGDVEQAANRLEVSAKGLQRRLGKLIDA